MNFEVPKFLKNMIEKDSEIDSIATGALASLFPWFQDNKLYFFPEFTDHGVDHINTVLKTAAQLIPQAAREKITPNDAGALIMAILLHDCAMHLSWDGFQTLLSGEYKSTSAFFQKEAEWPELFRAFMHQAQRWNQEKLLQVIGAVRPIKVPPTDIVDATEIDRRLIGEFLRIHHSRLAHEIAILGIPGPLHLRKNWVRPVSGSILPHDLIGFIARSHNLSLRSAKDYFPRHRQRSFQKIHAPYIMAVLRIADYLQIQSKRAHPSLLTIKSLKSSISVDEWKKHASTTDIHQNGDDPEALIVHTEPSDIGTLFALKNLFSSMQQELDNTWASLGEVYGGDNDLQVLAFKGLSIRRLQTNLDNLENFEKNENSDFIPEELKVRSAGADMFNLLVGPLYDNNASIAIREIVQNAVDACNERTAYERATDQKIEKKKILVRIILEEKGQSYLKIKDNGIGMTLGTIRDYFLIAGASFRKSQWWKSNFLDDNGLSKVQRSGRFGVGALASFLAGDQTTVISRHFSDTSGFGIRFSYRVDDKFIQASRVKSEIGTEISVEITSPEIIELLRAAEHGKESTLHWFGLSTPEIELTIFDNGEIRELKRSFAIPDADSALPKDWKQFFPENYECIRWSFKTITVEKYGSHPIFCNGIYVAAHWSTKDIKVSPGSPSIKFGTPTLAVFDPDGNFPLNLPRTGVAASTLPFHKELEDSLADHFVSETLLRWESQQIPLDVSAQHIGIPGLQVNQAHWKTIISSVFAVSKHGICPLDSSLLGNMKISKVLIISKKILKEKYNFIASYLNAEGSWILAFDIGHETKGETEAFFRVIMGTESDDRVFLSQLGRQIIGQQITAKKDSVDIATEKNRVPKYYFHGWQKSEYDDYTNFKTGNTLPSFSEADTLTITRQSGFFAEFFFADLHTLVAETPLSRAWRRAGRSTGLLPN